MSEIPPPIEARLRQLPRGLRDHTERVRELARGLARRHGVDPARVDLAIVAHDLARAVKDDALLEQARRYGLRVHPVARRNPVLLHGPVTAMWLQREGGIGDREVLEAVRRHTTGRKGMGPVAKVVFLADKLDPHKVERDPRFEGLAALAQESLDRALLEFLNRQLAYFLHRGRLIHPDSVELRNGLIASLDEQDG